MKRPLLLLASICFISLTGCSKDDPIVSDPTGTENPTTNPEEPESPIYFTFTARDAEDGSNAEEKIWVVLHDSNGEFLDYKKTEPGVELTFESVDEPVTDKVTVTFVEQYVFDGDISSYVNSYSEVEKGSVWAQQSYGNSSEQNGTFNFYAENVPEWNAFSVGSIDSFGAEERSSFYFNKYPDVEPGKLRADDIRIYAEDDFFFVLLDSELKSKYIRIPDVQAGDSVVVDASQLLDFDKITKIDLPQHNSINFGVTALSNSEGVEQRLRLTPRSFGSDSPLEAVELGYLDDFEEYRSYINVSFDNFSSYSYSKTGSAIDTFSFPTSPTFNVTSDSSADFGFTTSTSYVYQTTSFRAEAPVADGEFFSDNTTIWSYYAKPESFKALVSLPEDLLTESGIYLKDFEYLGTTIYTKSVAYDEVLNLLFSVSSSQEIVPSEKESFRFNPADDQSAKQAKERFSPKLDARLSLRGHEFF